ncbi:hypothetical protein BX592_12024 [Paraburkholderia rhizosphaerae]|uniref:Uncharacterized protein n=1 Tax=Paraburkholderia rhizosphaerae TaxID=480658 RepID=A0A4R8LHG1_9BURK|nr:hypothetical protein BX592_12024 [Paraburkholderia rhizosphaerae]
MNRGRTMRAGCAGSDVLAQTGLAQIGLARASNATNPQGDLNDRTSTRK